MSTFSTQNPATGENLKTYEHLSWDESEKAIQAADQDFHKWRKVSWDLRSQTLKRLASALREHKAEFASLMQNEMGKLIAEGKAEVEKCATTCEFYADHAQSMLQNRPVQNSPYAQAEVSFQPLGVIFSIMPWNFPLWQVLRFAAPVLMAGNVIVLKHADLTAGTAELLGKIFKDLTTEYTLLRNTQVDHDVAAKMIAHPLVRGVTFTGSTKGGKAIAAEAAKNLKKLVLELGGSDAYLVLADADVDHAAEVTVKARLVNCGQSCVAGKRFIVDKKISESYIQKFVSEMKEAPLAPLANVKFQKTIVEQVEKLKSWGGKVVLGGSAPQGAGAHYPATVIVFEKDRPEIHAEEVFGPVAIVLIAQNTEDALRMANASPYGLGGGVFTKDIEKGKALVEKELQAGFVVVNDFVKSDPHIPFGGVKESGYGRELGEFGIMEFVNIKTVAVAREKV